MWDVIVHNWVTHLPVQVPSTSVKSFCFTVLRRLGPKYLGCSKISCSKEICEHTTQLYVYYKTMIKINLAGAASVYLIKDQRLDTALWLVVLLQWYKATTTLINAEKIWGKFCSATLAMLAELRSCWAHIDKQNTHTLLLPGSYTENNTHTYMVKHFRRNVQPVLD